MPPNAVPLVSVVMATYNRSNILPYSIGSLLRSTLGDWELLVVGDACTDDTGAVVAAIDDPRIGFVNLPGNCGDQSGPNNEGVRRARGRYLAFLNHDDLWLSNHLEVAVGALERHEDDMVFTMGLVLGPGLEPLLLASATSSTHYHPWMDIRATLWVMRREVADRVGPWRRASEIRRIPSQDWIHRAWKRGTRIRHVPEVTALLLTSAAQDRVYSRRLVADQREAFAGLDDEGRLVAGLLARFASRWASHSHDLRPGPFLAEGARSVARRALYAVGVRPPSPKYWLRYWRRGGYIRSLMRQRGLEPK